MSLQLINHYYNELHRIQQFSGSLNEETIKGAFANLINAFARLKNLELVREVTIKSSINTNIRPDGILKNTFRLDCGYWESKDTKDDLDLEIAKKFAQGYPNNNILFEDSRVAILFQSERQIKISINDPAALFDLLQTFINYERPEISEFNRAITQFGTDLPAILISLRDMIETAALHNPEFRTKRNEFLQLCQGSINPNLDLADIREMLIQHILTEEIFLSIFNNADYHRENNIAQSLYEVEKTFFRGKTKQDLLYAIRPYYNTIKARANELVSHAEKQKFLKVVYENFYRCYNPKAADKLGIVYTPNEIVNFMISGVDFLLEKHFTKTLGSRGVEILDPCTGTGTFITQLIEHIPAHQLSYKYEHEIHANEIALLPYYVANLNIEAVYQQKMGSFAPFNNLCFVDTLDNTSALSYAGKQNDMFGALSLENVARIKRQNEKTISVIIGNPPYNAKQENYNFQNANRTYASIDKRIKETYIEHGTAQNQIVVYDMYTRFYRWASDRINDNGIICFISNSSFIDSRAFDGFRKIIQEEFDFVYIVDFGGDIRKLSGKDGIWMNEEHTIFGKAAAVGIAVMFLVKVKGNKNKCRIKYIQPLDIRATRIQKFEWIASLKSFSDIEFELIAPDNKNNWINQTDNDFDSLIPLIDKEVKAGKRETAIFRLFSSGIKTQRDEWVYDFSQENLTLKIKYFVDVYQATLNDAEFPDKFKIKWDRELTSYLNRDIEKEFETKKLMQSTYRPFIKKFFYFDRHLNGMIYQWENIFENNFRNRIITFKSFGSNRDFNCLVIDNIGELHVTGANQCLPLYRYEDSSRIENITDWALELFRNNYSDQTINKENIFHYVYAVLHNPAYREKYAQNLKRDFPRIPFYGDFWRWEKWGQELMELHLNYETTAQYELTRREQARKNSAGTPKVKLKADKVAGLIEIDEETTLLEVPAAAWEYKLGNRSALEWVLDQYKEKKPSDPTIAEKFNNYRFADYKEAVIVLLGRVCTVSVATMRIIAEMAALLQ